MTSKAVSHEEAKSPDAFLTASEKALKFIESNIRPFALGALAALLVGGGLAARSTWLNHVEMKATQELYALQSAVAKIQDEQERLAAEENDKAGSKSTPKKVEFAVYQDAVESWKAGLKANSGRVAAQSSAIQLAGFLATHDQQDMAAQVLSEFHGTKSPLLEGLLKMQHAGLAAEKGDWTESARLYQAVLDQKDLSYFHPLSSLRLGLVLAEAGEHERSADLLERVATENMDSDVGSEARGLLRLVRWKHKQVSRNQEAPRG